MNDFDWVSALSSCSVGMVFEQLKQQADNDVKIRQSQRPQAAHYGFRFLSASIGSFSIFAEGNNIHCAVHFNLRDRSIQVDGQGYDGAPSFEATLTLNDEGECRAQVNGQEREFWQVRKMALEKLFFKSY